MARPHLEFIQTQTVPWRELGEGQARPGASVKVLSQDRDTKACTEIMRYPKGWRIDRPHYLTCDEELYVLDGSFAIGAVTYQPGDYAYLPAGMPRPDMSSDEGASVLTFFEGPHTNVIGETPGEMYDPARLIARIATRDMPWAGPSDPVIAAMTNGAGRKSLRKDPVTGDQTWILTLGPDDPAQMTEMRTEIHPVVEESFLLDGEVSMQCGVMQPGAYFWRPPGKEHGPVGTLKGLTGFFRTKGGTLSTQWSEKAYPIAWRGPYQPTLTEEAKAFAHNSYDPALAY
jgi:hypothetical protein